MTTISTQEDFLQALRDNPAWREAVRALILGDELLQLPVRFDAFEKRFDAFEQRVDARFDRMEGDISQIKAYFAEAKIIRNGPLIALGLGQQYRRNLELNELVQLVQQGRKDNVPVIVNSPAGGLESFARADLVMETESETGIQYIAVEISFTGAQRDVNRVRRNAEFLTALTGQPATAVIAGVRNDRETQAAVNAGQVHWYRIPEQDLQPGH